MALDDYCAEIAALNRRRREKMRLWLLRPRHAYDERQRSRMLSYLESQLGRRYSVKSYLRGKRSEGIHCAELAANALNSAGRLRFARSHRESPASLMRKLAPSYAGPRAIVVRPRPRMNESWASRAQRRCAEWALWCSWSWVEMWMFCW